MRRLVPGIVLATAMLFSAAFQFWTGPDTYDHTAQTLLLTALVWTGSVLAVAICGRWPGLALGILWAALGLHLVMEANFFLAEAGVLYVAFACAAWGDRRTLWLSALSIPAAVTVLAQFLFRTWLADPRDFSTRLDAWGLLGAAQSAHDSNWGPGLVLAFTGILALTVPWLLGLAVRLRRRSTESERSQVAAEAARDEATEVAQLRQRQAQLSRDVHDVVGHSLTVILAQAESAQFHEDPDALKRTLTTITDTARSSLADVRQVLHDTGSHPVEPPAHDLATLLDGVRAGGRDLHFTDVGQARPLPPDRAPVAHRVLQEMLTNAVRHGDPSAPIRVERHWGGDLRLEVTNALPTAPAPDETQPIRREGAPQPAPRGRGLEGMARRLEAVGGRLDHRRREDPGTFTTTAWIPLPGRVEHPR